MSFLSFVSITRQFYFTLYSLPLQILFYSLTYLHNLVIHFARLYILPVYTVAPKFFIHLCHCQASSNVVISRLVHSSHTTHPSQHSHFSLPWNVRWKIIFFLFGCSGFPETHHLCPQKLTQCIQAPIGWWRMQYSSAHQGREVEVGGMSSQNRTYSLLCKCRPLAVNCKHSGIIY